MGDNKDDHQWQFEFEGLPLLMFWFCVGLICGYFLRIVAAAIW